jgi:[ribosomal protein S18]-alanine N-acetyltransferase
MTPPRIQLRPAVAEDLNAILDLERDTGTAPHWPRATYAAILSADSTAPQRCLIVAHDGELPAGFAVGLLHPGGSVAELESIVVAVGVRRSGVGRALCTAVFEWCRSHGATEIILEVRAAGTAAVALYTSLGFTQTGRRPRYYRDPEDDAIIMRLPLPSSPPVLSSSPA